MYKKMKTFDSFIDEGNSESGQDTNSMSTEDKYKVSDKLNECYDDAIYEAQEWSKDVHDSHTIESYMSDNASLVAGLSVKVLKACNSEYTTEQFEAAVNTLKDSYSKKINEMIDMESSNVNIAESSHTNMYTWSQFNEVFVRIGMNADLIVEISDAIKSVSNN